MANQENEKVKILVAAESKRLVTKIFKYSLMVLEDLRSQHLSALEELKHLKSEDIKSLNYLDFNRYSLLRKRILDNGNESVRDLENFLENFEFSLKNIDVLIKHEKEKGKNYDKQ